MPSASLSATIPALRSTHLDGLRGIAALIVVLHHVAIGYDSGFYSGVMTPGHSAWGARLGGWPFMFPLAGNYSVCVFFALSGYVLSSSFRQAQLGALALTVKRALRLGIPILAVTLFAWALAASGLIFSIQAQLIDHSWWLGLQPPPAGGIATALRDGLYGALLGLPNATAFDSALWTMSIEFAGSLLLIAVFAGMRPFCRPGGSDAMLAAVFLALGMLGYFLYLCLFAFGAALRLSNLRGRLERQPGLGWIMAGLLILGAFFGTLPYGETRAPWIGWLAAHALVTSRTGWQAADGPFRGIANENFWHAVGAMLTLVSADSWCPLRKLLDRPATQFLGKISFPLYLVHTPVLLSLGGGTFVAFFHAGLPASLAWTFGAALAVSASVLLAWAATPVVETGAVRWSSRAGQFCETVGVWIWTKPSDRIRARALQKS